MNPDLPSPFTTAQRQRIDRVATAAMELSATARRAFVEAECSDDPAVRDELLSLLDAAERPGQSGFLNAPPTLIPLDGADDLDAMDDSYQRIGNYQLIQKIGEGGFGVVHLAEQKKPVRRRVALKIIKLGMDTRQVIARFEQERQALAVMDHPNIAKVLDAGATDSGRPYFVMEYVNGVPITDFCDKNNTSFRDRLALFMPVCAAVQHAHQKGIIHRDIKPSNVLVTLVDGKPVPKVIDFGIAKATASQLTEHSMFTELGQFVGTPAYMSPEQADTLGGDIDTRSDIYSLGVLLYELLTGVTPFDVKTLRQAGFNEIMRIIREVEPPRPSTRLSMNADTLASVAAQRHVEPKKLVTLLRGEIDWIVMKALEKDRNRRYETANGLAMDIERYLSGEVVTAAPPSAAYRFKKFIRRNRAIMTAAGAVSAALLIGLVAFAWQAKVTAEQRDRAVAAETNERKRADELQLVTTFQQKMLQQVDVSTAGMKLMSDLRARHGAAMEKVKVPADEKVARSAAFDRELQTINATDSATAVLDRTVIEPAVRTIQSQFADQPLVRASLLVTMGTSYDSLARTEQALGLYEKAYTIRKAELGDDHRDTLLVRGGVAMLLGKLQRFTEAEAGLRSTLAALQRLFGEDDKDTLDAKDTLSLLLFELGKYDECEALTRDVLDRRLRLLGPDSTYTLKVKYNVGRVLIARGKFADATKVLREVLEAQRRIGDPTEPVTLNSLATALNRQREYAEAETYQREVLELTRRSRGEEHPETLVSLSNLAVTLMQTNKLPEAESLASEALEKSRRIRGNDHPETLKTINIMGQVLSSQRKPAEAEPYYREAMETGRRVLGEDHPDTIVWISNMSRLMSSTGRLAEAEQYQVEALEKSRRTLGEIHPTTIQIARNLGEILRNQNKQAELELLFKRLLESFAREKRPDDAVTLGVLGTLGNALRAQNKLAEAEECFQQCMDKAQRLFGQEHPETYIAILRLAGLRQAQGKYADVVALLTPIDGKAQKAIPGMTGVLHQASLRGLLGQARAATATQPADYSMAEADLLEAQSQYAKNRGINDMETRRWTTALVSLYDAWNKLEPGKGYDTKAAEWRAKTTPGKP